MSVQFGRWNFDEQHPTPEYIEKVCTILAPYAPDRKDVYSKGGLTILCRAFHTTKESHHEIQPHISLSGDRKSTRLNSSHDQISYAVFCLKKKKKKYYEDADKNKK